MSIQLTPVAVSPHLAAAQEQLSQRRQQRRQERLEAGFPIHMDARGRQQCAQLRPSSPPLSTAALPSHLGWESEGFVRAQRAAAAQRARRAAYEAARSHQWIPPLIAGRSVDRVARQKQQPETVRLYPELAIAMLRQEATAAGRLWLLLQHLDEPGRGWVRTADARARLCNKNADHYLCGWRQLRNLLAQGDGLFWRRDDGAADARIWLASTARVALRLGITRVRLAPVALPVARLLDGIGTVRAHFYASYHSSRCPAPPAPDHGENPPRPIARATLAGLTHVSVRSQRAYETLAGVGRQPNWAIGPAQREAAVQELAWEHGPALFTFTDRHGHYGAPGNRYLAWQLPNSYQGPHLMQGRRHQKALNQQLVDLYSKGFTGNDRQEVEGEADAPRSRFYDNGQAAVRALNRGLSHDAYWRTAQLEKQAHIWHLLPASETAT